MVAVALGAAVGVLRVVRLVSGVGISQTRLPHCATPAGVHCESASLRCAYPVAAADTATRITIAAGCARSAVLVSAARVASSLRAVSSRFENAHVVVVDADVAGRAGAGSVGASFALVAIPSAQTIAFQGSGVRLAVAFIRWLVGIALVGPRGGRSG